MTKKEKEKLAVVNFIQKSDLSFFHTEMIIESIKCEPLRILQILSELCYENLITPTEYTVWGVPIKYYKTINLS